MTLNLLARGLFLAALLVLVDAAAEEKRAWVTLFAVENIHALHMIVGQIGSIQRFSKLKEHVTLVLPGIGEDFRAYLSTLPTKVVEVPRILPAYEITENNWSDVFGKIHLFNMVQYDQLAYLDNDAFLWSAETDDIFRDCTADLCATRDQNDLVEGVKPMINGGILSVRPDPRIFDKLMELLPSFQQHFYNDMPFLSEIFVLKERGAPPGTFQFLDLVYNSCQAKYFKQYWGCSKERDPAACLNPFFTNENVKIIHACGEECHKFQKLPFCEASVEKRRNECARLDIQLFQSCVAEYNPCFAANDAASCERHSDCQWCSQNARCIPALLKRGCTIFAKDRTTQPRPASGTAFQRWQSALVVLACLWSLALPRVRRVLMVAWRLAARRTIGRLRT